MILGKKLGAKANRELKICRTIDKLRKKLEESDDSGLGKIAHKVQRSSVCAGE